MSLKTTNTLGGAPLMYSRGEGAPTWQNFVFAESFYDRLNTAFVLLASRYKHVVKIYTAGTLVDKKGAHKTAEAFDLDAIEFEDGEVWTADGSNILLSLAIQGFFIQRFRTVLTWLYDEAHADHFHIEFAAVDSAMDGVKFLPKSSIVGWMQRVMNLRGAGLKVDGKWGPKTSRRFASYWSGNDVLGVTVYPTDSEYRDFVRTETQTLFSQALRNYEPPEPAGLKDPNVEALERIGEIVRVALLEHERRAIYAHSARRNL